MQDNKRSEQLTSYFLRKKMLPYGIKIQILLYAFLLITFNCIITYQKDDTHILYSLIGVLPSFVKLKTKTKAYISAVLSFFVVIYSDSIFFYVIYGYVLSSTYQIASSICLCLRKESFEFLRKLEVFCLILPNMLFISKTHVVYLLIVNLALIYKAQTPPHEYIDKKSLAKIYKYIKDIIIEEDYCLIAEEHRMIIKNELCTMNTISDQCLWFDAVYPLWVLDIHTLSKIAIFSFSLFSYTKYSLVLMFFYVFLVFELPIISVLMAPFCKVSNECDFSMSRISVLIICRIVTGFVFAKILKILL